MKPKYEWLILRNDFTDRPILDDDGNYMSWKDAIPEGWNVAFGEQMIDELNEILIKYNFVKEFRFLQIKEKFGELRMYSSSIPDEMYNEYSEWENKYEKMSKHVCIKCGKSSTHMTKGWILPLCDDCDKGDR